MALPASLDTFLSALGVEHVLRPYETMPWSCYDADTGTTCTAEVRMNSDGKSVEAEAQLMYDTPPDDETPPMQQICLIKARESSNGWTVEGLRIKGAPFGEDIYNWQEKACRFFQELVTFLLRDEIPDIDALIEATFTEDEQFYDQWGGGGGKKPKINTAKLMNNKKSGF